MHFKKAGVVGVKDMTLETVIVKSMLLIKKYPADKDKFEKGLLSNIAGEIQNNYFLNKIKYYFNKKAIFFVIWPI